MNDPEKNIGKPATRSDENTYDILDEYVDVTNKIKEIQEIMDRYHQDVKAQINNTRSERKKIKIIEDFTKNIKKIKKSDMITHTYKQLKQRQVDIRNILISDSSISISIDTQKKSQIKTHSTDIISILNNIEDRMNYEK
jgi:DNA repair ATPase RecN